MLTAIDIKVPADLANGEEYETPLLDFFYLNKEAFVNGVTNSSGASAVESFFFHNVCPKLQVHGLIVNEKVPGVRYRRSAVSPLGHSFLAEIERSILLSKKPNQRPPSNEGAALVEPAATEVAAKRPRTTSKNQSVKA